MNRMMFFGFEMSIDALISAALSGPDWPTATGRGTRREPDRAERPDAQYAHPFLLVPVVGSFAAGHLRLRGSEGERFVMAPTPT